MHIQQALLKTRKQLNAAISKFFFRCVFIICVQNETLDPDIYQCFISVLSLWCGICIGSRNLLLLQELFLNDFGLEAVYGMHWLRTSISASRRTSVLSFVLRHSMCALAPHIFQCINKRRDGMISVSSFVLRYLHWLRTSFMTPASFADSFYYQVGRSYGTVKSNRR